RRRPYESSSARAAAGSAGRNPGGPASVACTPSARMSPRTRSGASCRPQFGTSQTPQEIGAAASFICVKEIRSLESRRVKIAVFCEKPIALDLESTRRVVDHVDKTKGRVQIGFQRRFDAGFQEARRRVRGGHLGTVYSFHMTSRDALPPPDAYVETSGGQFV